MSFCHKLWFYYSQISQTINHFRSNNDSLKCQRFTPSGCKDSDCKIRFCGKNLVPLSNFRYPSTRFKYPWITNPITILILHLSFCDLLYCLFGLPFLTLPPLYGYFPFSKRTCRVTSLLRNLNAYAEFLTIALIALLR